MRPKILIIENSTGVTGAFKSIISLTQHLTDQFEFHFAIPTKSPVRAELSKYRTPFIELPFSEIRKHWSVVFYFPLLLINTVKLQRYCRAHGIQLIHVNDLYNMAGAMMRMLNSRIRLVYHVRLLRSSYAGIFYRLWVKLIGKSADQILVVSKAVKLQVEEILGTSKKIRMIYDFVPLEGDTLPITPRRSATRFLYPANYIPGKGHVFALEAFANALKRNPDIFLEMRGDDLGLAKNRRFKDSLSSIIKQKNLDHAIVVGGSYKSMEDLLQRNDVVLMFSESESFSMVCYEAMYYGLAVVATRCGGPEEFITDQISGILVDNKDIAGMEKAILRVSTDSQLRLNLGRQAAAEVRERIVQNRPYTQLSDVYTYLVTEVTFNNFHN
jgi:L-malate glycosyltransferase